MNPLFQVLTRRLEKKGLESVTIPGFTRDVVNTIATRPHMGLKEINRRLHSLGRSPFELDDHTFQLLLANFEAEGV